MPENTDLDEHDLSHARGRSSVFPEGPRAVAWVLEDSAQQAEVLRAALADMLDVRVFLDSLTFLEAFGSTQPDVVILDWMVPDVSGLEVLRIIRQTHDEVTLPALVLTAGQGDPSGHLEALVAGANDYAIKPFVALELRARLSTLVRVRRLHARARSAERELTRVLAQTARAREEALAERERSAISEERLRRVVEASGVGLWELDAQSGAVEADARMLVLMGRPGAPGLDYEGGFELVHAEDRARLHVAVDRALRGEQGGSYLIEFRTGGRDGAPLRWIESRAQASFDDAGAPTRLSGAIVDITARKQTEIEREMLLAREASARAEAQREREKLQSIFVHAPVAIAVLEGPEHVFSFANEAYLALVNGRDIVGKRLLEALPEVVSLGIDNMLDAVMATGEPVVVNEMPIVLEHHRDDEPLILNFMYNAKSNEHGARDGVVMFGWDVTELVLARQRMAQLSMQQRASEAQLRLVTNAVPLLISFVDAQEVYGFVNKAYEDWFGISTEQIVGRRVRDVVGEPAYAVLGAYVKRGLAGERFSFEQYDVPYRRGGTRDVRVTFVPLTLQEGTPSGYVALLDDITQQRAMQAERERLAHERAEQQARQSQFEQQLIGIVSHDLRTPLNVISLSSARVARGEELSVSAHKNVVRIQNATDRAIRMVSDLLDFTQARLGGGLPIERRSMDVHVLLDKLLAELEAAYADRQITCSHEGDGRGDWDPDRIAQLAQNLLTNALKYSPADSVVEVSTKTEAGALTLRVHNLGEGIAADELPTLFEPLQRGLARTDRVSRSVGLGLYIVKKIAEAHDGQVQVVSSPAGGTTFTVTLPIRPSHDYQV